jgi:hypothetical protein
MSFIRTLVKPAIVLASLACAATPDRANAAQAQEIVSAQDVHDIAVEAYLYFYPLISMDVTRRQTNAVPGAPPNSLDNKFFNVRTFPPADFKLVVRSNFDTLYSTAWLNLTSGPVIVSTPDTHGRHYLLPMLDMWSDVFAAPGKRTTGTAAGNFAVVPPGWKGELPEDVVRIDAPTPYVWVCGRTQTNGPQDYAAVNKIQDGYIVTPLSKWGQPPAPVEAMLPEIPKVLGPSPVDIVDHMPPLDYFRQSVELMKENPPHLTDWSMIARLRRIGIEVGQSFEPERLDLIVREALMNAAADGQKAMRAKAPTLGRIVNGWQMNTDTMGVYGNYYLKRAIIAQIFLSANQPEDAIYPLIVADAEGNAPTGDNRYVLHFDKAALPPVGAFWSLSMYDAQGFQIANPLNRFAIGDRDPLRYNADGSLDLYVQHDDPGVERNANWLPSPNAGLLGLTMRLYAPKPTALDGSWAPPPLRRQP